MPYRRLLTPVLVSLALLGAACAAEEAVPAPSPEPAPTTAQEQEATEPSESEAAPTTTEGQPTVTAVEAEATPDVAPTAETAASPTTEEAPEVEPATAPEAEPEATPEPDAAPEAEVTPEPEAAPEPEDAPESEPEAEPEVTPEPEATPEAEVTPEPEATPEPEPEATPEPEPEADPEPESTPEPEDDQQPSSVVAEVLALLDALTVAAEHTDGYDRDLFRHWIDADRDGCDTRREVLLDEAVVEPTVGQSCALANGQWVSRYDGQTAEGNGRSFDVDHLVPLAESWESGAHGWSSQRREDYANDLGYENSLIAVSAGSNRSKGAKDPATWLPPEAGQHCWYAASWVHVKTRWTLTIDQTEASTLRGILNDCSDDSLDIGLPAAVIEPEESTTTGDSTTTEADESTTEEPTTPETPEPDCHPAYSPCLPNMPGDALNCGDLTSDQKPVTVLVIGEDPYRLDRDRDGQGCTS